MTKDMTTVAVLGTGIMGAPIARNIAAAGMHVRAWNRTAARAQSLAGDGITVAASPAEAVRGADLVVTMLADETAVADTVTSSADGLSAGQVWIQCSTVGVAGAARLGNLAARLDLVYVDAPVLGTKQPAEAGELTVLASGPDSAHDACTPVFEAIGSATRWLGEAGQGSRFKLVMNSWVLALVTATAETMALAEGLGFDPRLFLSSIRGGPLDVGYAQSKGQAMAEGSFPAAFPVWGAAKDAGLILEAGVTAGVRLRLAEAVHDQMTTAAESGYADEDMAAVFRVIAADGK
jgi:3-hydroxyisobutyrate dehydrogenase